MKRNHSRPQNVISVGFLKTFSVKSWWGLLISPNGWLPLLFCIVNKRYWDALSPPWYMIHNSEGKYQKSFFGNKSENMFFFFFWRGGVPVVGEGNFFRFTKHTFIEKIQCQKSDTFKWCAQNLKGFKIPTELLRVLECRIKLERAAVVGDILRGFISKREGGCLYMRIYSTPTTHQGAAHQILNSSVFWLFFGRLRDSKTDWLIDR